MYLFHVMVTAKTNLEACRLTTAAASANLSLNTKSRLRLQVNWFPCLW